MKKQQILLAKGKVVAFKSLAENTSTDKVILAYDVTQMIESTSVLGDVF